jgi:hypothetical protein
MLLHQLGQHLILPLELLLQVLDPLLPGLVVDPHLTLEGRRAVFKKLLLPAVEDRRPQPQLVTELRDRLLFQQMAPQNGDFLFSGVVLSLLFHASSP